MSRFNSLETLVVGLDEIFSRILKSSRGLIKTTAKREKWKKASAEVKMLMMGKFSPFPCSLTNTCRLHFFLLRARMFKSRVSFHARVLSINSTAKKAEKNGWSSLDLDQICIKYTAAQLHGEFDSSSFVIRIWSPFKAWKLLHVRIRSILRRSLRGAHFFSACLLRTPISSVCWVAVCDWEHLIEGRDECEPNDQLIYGMDLSCFICFWWDSNMFFAALYSKSILALADLSTLQHPNRRLWNIFDLTCLTV